MNIKENKSFIDIYLYSIQWIISYNIKSQKLQLNSLLFSRMDWYLRQSYNHTDVYALILYNIPWKQIWIDLTIVKFIVSFSLK